MIVQRARTPGGALHPPPEILAFSEGRELCCKLVIQFSCYFLLPDRMVFEKPPFSLHLIYREHSTYACRVTTVSLWKLLMRFPIAQYIYMHNGQSYVNADLHVNTQSAFLQSGTVITGSPIRCTL